MSCCFGRRHDAHHLADSLVVCRLNPQALSNCPGSRGFAPICPDLERVEHLIKPGTSAVPVWAIVMRDCPLIRLIVAMRGALLGANFELYNLSNRSLVYGLRRRNRTGVLNRLLLQLLVHLLADELNFIGCEACWAQYLSCISRLVLQFLIGVLICDAYAQTRHIWGFICGFE